MSAFAEIDRAALESIRAQGWKPGYLGTGHWVASREWDRIEAPSLSELCHRVAVYRCRRHAKSKASR